ncbi:MAG: metal-dependent transcriptional regulator [Candidatus Korarchaeota archaeon]|nr:metal-dependent transcriptional regulator [Candidatus Korarchaeota archaeon]NIU83423.1 metal-dependent transcriptional regulator [Candidatus Thorarchaeota archaeon]NIW13695.1 metal-dependent transcriptional regulator [Candidatus Thorarchaeota archaeon]NIW51794.1 metal-dependent transcriptional regulator [Candidatus Korarchaeota archaeon]
MKTQTVERYVETIYELEEQTGKARTKEIAVMLDVKEPSVTEMLKKLKKKGYLKYRRYYGANLTKKGKELAKRLNQRHVTFAKFLKMIGVDAKTAEDDACKIEHVVTTKTMEKLTTFLKYLEEHPEELPT